jgi:outer membrane protein assembly factor BamD (BamD/ComL family)
MNAELDLLKAGGVALRQGNYTQAISNLIAYQKNAKPGSREYGQAQMWLVKSYQGNG